MWASRSVASAAMATQIRFWSKSWQVAQAAVLAGKDAVFDAGVAAVAQFQVGQLAPGPAGGGVGEETGDPHPVVVGDTQLRPGVRAFLTQDQPGARQPGRQVDQLGELGDPGPVAELDPRTGLPGAGLAGLILSLIHISEPTRPY